MIAMAEDVIAKAEEVLLGERHKGRSTISEEVDSIAVGLRQERSRAAHSARDVLGHRLSGSQAHRGARLTGYR